jgi:predicted SnoaL-like aldol condensation-catalyzing enzyme
LSIAEIFFDVFRLEDGLIVEHWVFAWKNNNGLL